MHFNSYKLPIKKEKEEQSNARRFFILRVYFALHNKMDFVLYCFLSQSQKH